LKTQEIENSTQALTAIATSRAIETTCFLANANTLLLVSSVQWELSNYEYETKDLH